MAVANILREGKSMFTKKVRRSFIIMVLMFSFVLLFGGCTSPGNDIPSSDGTKPPQEEQGDAEEVQEGVLPDFLTITSYDIGTVTYAHMAGISEGILKHSNIKIRQRVSGTESGRIIPVRTGDAHFVAGTSNTVYFANEGTGDFATVDWGPQGLQQVWVADTSNVTLVTSADSGIKTPYDLKGRKYPYAAAAGAATFVHEALLRFAGLTWDDVEVVELPGAGAIYNSILEGRTDAVGGGLSSAVFYELEGTRRGIHVLEFPKDDEEGWARMQAFAPHFFPKIATEGAGIKEGETKEVVAYAAPVILTYSHLDEYIAYSFTKAIHESFDYYKDLHPDLPRFAIEEAITLDNMVAPYHEGSVRYFKEIGWWNDEFEAKQNQLLARQAKLKELWDKALNEAEETGIKAGEFTDFWLKKREEGLN